MTTTIEITIPEEHLKVLTLLKEGDTVKEIAKKLSISKDKVKNIKYLYVRQFDCTNTTSLIAVLMEKGII